MKGIRITFAALLMAGMATTASAQTMSYSQAGALLAKSCGPDINRLCPKANLGGGELKACMDAQISKVSAQCKADYAIAVAGIAARDAAQDAIVKLCDRDARQFCAGMVPQDGNLLSCLLEATKVVSKTCNQAITDAGYR